MALELLEIGKLAPAFTMLNQNGDKISLKDFRGKKTVVLYFYPKAMTPGCTVQACGIRDRKNEFQRLDTVVLGVSIDEYERLKRFEGKQELNFDLLADPEHKTADKYKVWGLKKFMGKEYMGLNRVTYIIGKDGKIAQIMPKVKTKSHNDDILELLKELQ
ncbi:MAG: thioredoxin-dependent thiol peroxidase [Bacteriovoracaceae bacterium]|nr:thioredoxin-dependent thiol peroxidase [Bacteriovoracaceae bacterium]